MQARRRGQPSRNKQWSTMSGGRCCVLCWGTARGPAHPSHQESAGKLMGWPLASCRVEGKAEQQEWELAKQCRRKSLGGRK